MQSKNNNLFSLIKKIKKNREIYCFDDYYTSSIHVDYFAKILLKLISKRENGIFNIASKNSLSKSNFLEILSNYFNDDYTKIIHKSVDILKVKRTKYCNLKVNKIEKILNMNMPKYEKSIKKLALDYL